MDHFTYSDGELFCEGVPLRTIAEKAGTPLYVYSHATLQRHYRVFDEAFKGTPHIICYSCIFTAFFTHGCMTHCCSMLY